MSDENQNEEQVEPQEGETVETTDTQEQDQQPQEGEIPKWVQDKIDKANREAKNLRTRLREAEPIVAAAKQAEEAQKSELQRAQDRLAESDKELTTLRRERLVSDLAADAGLPKKFWRRVSGDTQEEIEADIADLMEAFPVKDAGTLSHKPREALRDNLRGGSRPDEPVEETDPKKIVASIPRTFQSR